ncbi:POU domain, class 6, transcription factor 2 [Sparganum proliferum]
MAEQVSLWSVSDLVDSSSTKSQDGHNWPTFAPLGFSKVFLSHLKNVVSSEGGTTHNSSDPSPTSNATSFYDEISPDCLLPPQSASLPSQLLTLNMQFLVSSQKQEAERDQRADFSSSCHKDSCVMDTGSEQKMISPDHSLTKWDQAAVHSETKDERVDNRVSSEKRQKYGNRRDTTAEKKRKKISASSQDTNEHIEDIRRFARAFKMKRLSLGLTQTQIGRALTAADGPAYSQSAICRFEKLDITPKSAQRIKPVLERWLAELEGKKCPEQTPGLEENFVEDAVTRKRKSRTNFSTDALARLNCEFATNTHPSENQPNLYAMDGPLANMTTQMPGCGTNNGGSPSGDTGSTDLDDTWLPLDLSIRRRDSAQ